MIKVTITSGYRWSYFQWFILGLYRLQEEGIIKLKFKLPFFSMIMSKIDNKYLCRICDKGRRIFEHDSYNLCASIKYDDGKIKRFVIDSADAPYLFSEKELRRNDIYFKMQFPVDIDKEEFSLTDKIKIPWCDHEHVDLKLKSLTDRGERRIFNDFSLLKHKVKPLMVGPRMLAEKTFCRQALEKGYQNYEKDRNLNKQCNLMCYFGNAKGPVPEKVDGNPDYDWEADIVGAYADIINHPNEKRAKAAGIIEQMENCDARIICNDNADKKNRIKHNSIPLKDFCAHIAKFKYNLNISGYRLSMPSRFIESFMVGTAVITDKLHIKWYKPFGEEVVETAEMGYLPINEVDWEKVEQDIKGLPKVDPNQIIKSFEEKWKPEVVANYIIETVKIAEEKSL